MMSALTQSVEDHLFIFNEVKNSTIHHKLKKYQINFDKTIIHYPKWSEINIIEK